MAVFAHPNLKDPAFKILLTVSIVDFIYMILYVLITPFDMFCNPMPNMCGSNVQLYA
jgi:hypothetical protein